MSSWSSRDSRALDVDDSWPTILAELLSKSQIRREADCLGNGLVGDVQVARDRRVAQAKQV